MGKYDDRPYEVGKGKPPVNTRWKPGQSGNRRGARRRTREEDLTFRETLAKIVNEPIPVTIDGTELRVTKKYAIFLTMVHDALNGTLAQRIKVVEMLNRFNAFDLPSTSCEPTKEQQENTIEQIVKQLAEEAARDPGLPRPLQHPIDEPGTD